MNRALAPIRHRDSYTTAVERLLVDWFTEVVFGPLVELLWESGVKSERTNAKTSSLVRALRDGKVWYADGAFVGKFSASVAGELRSIGAVFNEGDHSFRIAKDDIPDEIKGAVVDSISRSKDLHWKIERTLDRMQENVGKAPLGIDFSVPLKSVVDDLQAQFASSVRGIDLITVPAEMTPQIAKALDVELTRNMDLYVKRFAEENIPELRKKVAANAFAGGRTDRLAKIIQADYGVAKRKAEFLAEQETSLVISKFREQRYREIGATRYRWSTSHDERVRKDHKELDGTTHFFDSPPITNKLTGARNNPGEDFRCRCVALPIVEITG